MAIFKSNPGKFDGGDITTIIGPETSFSGVLTVRGSVCVEGEVEGNVDQAHTVIVGRKGRVRGDICAEHVIVSGSVIGDVTALRQLELKAGGRVTGNIRTPKLLVEDGAVFEGNCVMGAEEGAGTSSEAAAEEAQPAGTKVEPEPEEQRTGS